MMKVLIFVQFGILKELFSRIQLLAIKKLISGHKHKFANPKNVTTPHLLIKFSECAPPPFIR